MRCAFPAGLLFLGLLACDPAPPATPVAPQPPPDHIQFPTTATSVRYTYYDDIGRAVVVRERGEVPEQLLDFTSVLLAERTNAPQGQVYRLRPLESDDRVSMARLWDEAPLKHASVAAWAATDLAIGAWESAMVSAELAGMEEASAESRTRTGAKRPKAATKRSAPTIEIVSISDDVAPTTVAKASDRVLAPNGWKSVTIYYTPTCPYCRRAMQWMDDNNVPYTTRNVEHDLRARTEMASAQRRTGRRRGGVPTFVIGPDRQVLQGWDRDRFVKLARR